jgi:hypothetical protein
MQWLDGITLAGTDAKSCVVHGRVLACRIDSRGMYKSVLQTEGGLKSSRMQRIQIDALVTKTLQVSFYRSIMLVKTQLFLVAAVPSFEAI